MFLLSADDCYGEGHGVAVPSLVENPWGPLLLSRVISFQSGYLPRVMSLAKSSGPKDIALK